MEPAADVLRTLLRYDPHTGQFTWLRLPRKSRKRVGTVAGYLDGSGYCLIKIDGFKHRASRLAWVYMTGEPLQPWPIEEIDHIDRDRSNDKWSNLRKTTHKQNHENLGPADGSVSGFRGVTWLQQRQKWLARIKHNGKTTTLGRFKDLQEAIEARLSAERRLFTHSAACAPPA